MNTFTITRRYMLTAGLAVLAAGCQAIPKSPTPPSYPSNQTGSGPSSLPNDNTRHRVALLVPLSGKNGAVGKSLANAATMALLDTNAQNLRITTYDTAPGAAGAAQRAINDQNRLILGPLSEENIPAVLSVARPAGVPLISYANNPAAARPDAFVLGMAPEQSVERSIAYTARAGDKKFAGLFPVGEYGDRDQLALRRASERNGGALVTSERYADTPTSLRSAAYRLNQFGGFDAAIIADGSMNAASAASILKQKRDGPVQIIGTELWSGDPAVKAASSLRGARFSAISDARFKRFADSYQARFGMQPFRISTLGYDSVLLTLRVAQDWRLGRRFPIGVMSDPSGFIGLDGAFRFRPNGAVERALEVREVRPGSVVIIDPAPERFGP